MTLQHTPHPIFSPQKFLYLMGALISQMFQLMHKQRKLDFDKWKSTQQSTCRRRKKTYSQHLHPVVVVGVSDEK